MKEYIKCTFKLLKCHEIKHLVSWSKFKSGHNRVLLKLSSFTTELTLIAWSYFASECSILQHTCRLLIKDLWAVSYYLMICSSDFTIANILPKLTNVQWLLIISSFQKFMNNRVMILEEVGYYYYFFFTCSIVSSLALPSHN